MGRRGYLFIDLQKDFRKSEFRKLLSRIDSIHEVDFVDVVDGSFDMVAMVQVPVSFEPVIKTIKNMDGVHSVKTCKVLGNQMEW